MEDKRSFKKTVKTHWQKNKKLYAGIGIGVATTLVYHVAKRADSVVNGVGIEGNHNAVEINNIGVQHNHAPKRLSYIVTDGSRWWESQTEAAREIGEHPQNVSRHLNHGKPLECGVNLERVGIRS